MSRDWTDLFGREHWEGVGRELAGGLSRTARAWWEEYQDDLEQYGKDELRQVLKTLRDEGTAEAKLYIALRMDREEWEKYRDGVTDELRGIAIRRARIMEALEDLGRRAARIIGAAAGAALGF